MPIQSYRRRNPRFPQGGRPMPRCRIPSANIRSALCIPCTTASPSPPCSYTSCTEAPEPKRSKTENCAYNAWHSRRPVPFCLPCFVCLVLSICFILLIRRYLTRGLGSKHVLSSRKPSFASITDTLISTRQCLKCSETTLWKAFDS